MAKPPTYQDLIDQSREEQRALDAMRRQLDQAVLRAQLVEPMQRTKPITLPRDMNDDYHRQFGMARPSPAEPVGALDARAVSRQRRRVLARGSRPNAGLEALYRQKLETKVGEMNASVLYWLRSAYRNNPPEMARDGNGILGPMDGRAYNGNGDRINDRGYSLALDSNPAPVLRGVNQDELAGDRSVSGDSDSAVVGGGECADVAAHQSSKISSIGDLGTPQLAMDRTPASILKDAFDKLAKRWLRQFDELADDLGKWFGQSAAERSDSALHQILRRSGMAVKFRLSPAMKDIMKATVEQNVALIKSIPEQYFLQVQQSVMRSVQEGRDLASLTKDLQQHYGVTKRRAKFIALSQNNLATAAFTRARQMEVGITHAIWVHSGGGKEPRPSHVKAGRDRVVYKISEGWFDPHEQKYIWPGTLPNCRCFSRSVIKGFEET